MCFFLQNIALKLNTKQIAIQLFDKSIKMISIILMKYFI